VVLRGMKEQGRSSKNVQNVNWEGQSRIQYPFHKKYRIVNYYYYYYYKM